MPFLLLLFHISFSLFLGQAFLPPTSHAAVSRLFKSPAKVPLTRARSLPSIASTSSGSSSSRSNSPSPRRAASGSLFSDNSSTSSLSDSALEELDDWFRSSFVVKVGSEVKGIKKRKEDILEKIREQRFAYGNSCKDCFEKLHQYIDKKLYKRKSTKWPEELFAKEELIHKKIHHHGDQTVIAVIREHDAGALFFTKGRTEFLYVPPEQTITVKRNTRGAAWQTPLIQKVRKIRSTNQQKCLDCLDALIKLHTEKTLPNTNSVVWYTDGASFETPDAQWTLRVGSHKATFKYEPHRFPSF